MTRRPIKGVVNENPCWPDETDDFSFLEMASGVAKFYWEEYPEEGHVAVKCPYGQPGDRLYVRETWAIEKFGEKCAMPTFEYEDYRNLGVPCLQPGYSLQYKADAYHQLKPDFKLLYWRPSIHMPRWASRINLEITSVRVERIQDIGPVDLKSEGHVVNRGYISQQKFRESWNATYGKPRYGYITNEKTGKRSRYLKTPGFGWDANPWVWVIEFKRITP